MLSAGVLMAVAPAEEERLLNEEPESELRQSCVRQVLGSALSFWLIFAGIVGVIGATLAFLQPSTTVRLVSGSTTTTTAVATHVTPMVRAPGEPPIFTFYMYRAQSDENYNPENQNMANLAGILWYLHNEIIFTGRWWHNTTDTMRSGSAFSVQKTRLERFKVRTRAPHKLFNKDMNFGVVAEFDAGRCTGPGRPGEEKSPAPKQCLHKFAQFGYAVGCESWDPRSLNNFPHTQWNNVNHYPGAVWYSLPGPCPSHTWNEKSAFCKRKHPGGACKSHKELVSNENPCTYTYEKVGELSIDEIEGLKKGTFREFVKSGGLEYMRVLDRGKKMKFWDYKNITYFCQKRIDHVQRLFDLKYPDQPHLPDPDCDFDWFKFFHQPGEKLHCHQVECNHPTISCLAPAQSYESVQWMHCCCTGATLPTYEKCRSSMHLIDYCRWTEKYYCAGQPKPPQGITIASNEGSIGYECCCDLGLWNKSLHLPPA